MYLSRLASCEEIRRERETHALHTRGAGAAYTCRCGIFTNNSVCKWPSSSSVYLTVSKHLAPAPPPTKVLDETMDTLFVFEIEPNAWKASVSHDEPNFFSSVKSTAEYGKTIL